ncbi:MAG: six-cysteine peptide SCIFF [Caldisericales bacterium]|nr:six-cysteine ranthipeptide SCIFF [Caldisericia bacterium]NLI40633.1 six-cysteine peptide SCIFF [Caldisericales bacterium]NMD14183.1 six-cysteine peptide SCIFF [Caldisericales bacterium]
MRIKIIAKKPACSNIDDENCRECQTPCKSAAKTANTISNQICEAKGADSPWIL